MKPMFYIVRKGIAQLIFPGVCLCCGQEPSQDDGHVCAYCLYERFEDANPENKWSASGTLLPDSVTLQHALWLFDKGGSLQTLMHYLKYERLINVGTQLGRVLAKRSLKHPQIRTLLEQNETILLPVPLHYLKFRRRGFNQAFYIARGLQEVLHLPICPIDSIVRRTFTRSQTGLTLQKRIRNMNGVFRLRSAEVFRNKLVIITDDVFTTGATSFELAKTIAGANPSHIIILTIARA